MSQSVLLRLSTLWQLALTSDTTKKILLLYKRLFLSLRSYLEFTNKVIFFYTDFTLAIDFDPVTTVTYVKYITFSFTLCLSLSDIL